MAYDLLNLAIRYYFAVIDMCLISCYFGVILYCNAIISALQLAVPISKYVAVILAHQVCIPKVLLDLQAYKLVRPYPLRQVDSLKSWF